MKTPLLFLLLALAVFTPLRAAEDPRLAKLSAADDARIAAMKSPTQEKLATIFSDELHYAHSSGVLDTKASFIESLVNGRSKYLGYDLEERKFTFPAPGIALMTGRTHIRVENATGTVTATLSYLGVWREEEGQWRFLAWQSCRLPAPAPAGQ